MKTLTLTIAGILLAAVISAQALPFKYQAVLRNEGGEIIQNQNVSLRFSILSGESAENEMYGEIFDLSTNDFGQININIGEGLSVFGDYEDVDWNNEFVWLKVELDENAGLDFEELGTSRLLAVPFANYAAKADYNKLDNLPSLFDGDYNSLTSAPELFSGDYNELSNLPVLFNGDYSELTNAPELFSGNYDDLTNIPALFDGTWTSLSGKPIFQTVAFSGSYHDLEELPILFSGSYNDLSNKPSLFSGNYNDLTNKPALFDGTWTSLTGKPTFATVATSGSYNDLSSKPNLTVYATKDMGGQNITNLGDPVNTNDAATKEYVDELEAKLEALEEMLVSYGTMVRDYDGNIYNTVKIGTQTWMAENLRTTHLADGTPIAEYYSANNNSANDESYGLLYDWTTTMNGSASSSSNPSGVTGICPTGWHVPSDSEWKTMEAFLGMDASQLSINMAWRGTDQGTQLKPGGSTGFNVNFAGIRYNFNQFSQFGTRSSYWTSTTGTTTAGLYRSFEVNNAQVWRNSMQYTYYLSVRCVKN
jgi:uncharacterized protein (TIGR02145 family)